MLHINDLSYRIGGRPLFEKATAGIPEGYKVGLVGRNGTGKSTLLRLIASEIMPDDGSISFPKNARLGYLTQEAPALPQLEVCCLGGNEQYGNPVTLRVAAGSEMWIEVGQSFAAVTTGETMMSPERCVTAGSAARAVSAEASTTTTAPLDNQRVTDS